MKKFVLLFICILTGFSASAQVQKSISDSTSEGSIHIPVREPGHVFDTEKPDFKNLDFPKETRQKQVAVKGEVWDASGILMVTIENKNGFTRNARSKEFEFTIPLQTGNNQFKLTAFDTKGNPNEKTLNIKRLSRDRKDYALLFAINDYSQNPSYSNLDNCISDAQEIEKVLDESFGFKTELIDDPEVSDMREKLKDYAEKDYGEQDQLLIYYSGHGDMEIVGQNKMGHFADGKGARFDHNSFTFYADAIPCEHILLITDACYSGLIKSRSGELDDDFFQDLYRGKQADDYTKQVFSMRTRKLIASGVGRTKDISNLKDKLIKGLRNSDLRNNYGYITFYELAEYINSNVKASLWGSFHNNDADESNSNFLFIPKK